MTTTTRTDHDRAIDYLTDPNGINLQPGDTLYVSAHGATETFFKVFVIRPRTTGEPALMNITWAVATAIGWKPRDRRGAWFIHRPHTGSDAAFEIVFLLSRTLFAGREIAPEGRPIPASDDPGYLLNATWL